MKLEILKTYSKTYLKTRFIQLFKFWINAPIFLDKKSDSNFYLCVDNQDLNSLIVKNFYPFSLAGELLNWLGWAKYFTK